jgi:sugar phosphate isomerase/epimerase
LRQRLLDNGVRCLAWAMDSDFTVAPLFWLAQLVYIRQALAAADLLQAEVVRLTLGGVADAPQAVNTLVARRLALVAAWAARRYRGLRLVVENHWGLATEPARLVAILDEAARLLKSEARSPLGVCFDPSNMPEAARAKGWPLLAGRATHFHLKTTAFTPDGAEASLPYRALFALLGEVGYRGPVVIEYGGDEPAEAGIRQSEALFRSLMAEGE